MERELMRLIKQLYELLLLLYPSDLRALFAAEMSTVFGSAAEEQRFRGRIALARFVCAELYGLLRDAVAERAARLIEPVFGRRVPGGIDLTQMRAPKVSRQAYTAAIDEVLDARRQVDINLRRMTAALSRNDFVEARFYSDEERKAREYWRLVQRKYRIAE
jgi:hypothetical protein